MPDLKRFAEARHPEASKKMHGLKFFLQPISIVLLLILAATGTAISGEDYTQTEEQDLKQERRITLDPVLVTARGRQSLASETPGGVGVVDREEISELNPISLTNAAARIPGVDKSSDSAWGSAMTIRGLGRNAVIFLVDGCRVNTSTDINARFGLVNPLDIEQIEVLKGPISALYGSGSTGGVVNIITRKGKFTPTPTWTGEITNTLATNPQGNDSYGLATYNSKDLWVSASAGFRDHTSYESGSGEKIDNSQFEDLTLNASLGLRENSLNTTRFQVQHLRGEEIGIPGRGLALPTGPDVTYPDVNRTLVNLTHTLAPDNPLISESSINLFYQKIERRVRLDHFPGGPITQLKPQADHDTWGAKWQNTLTPQNHTIVAGVDIWNWEISNSNRYRAFASGLTGVDASLADVEQFSGGVFMEDEWRLGKTVHLNLGARMDYISADSQDLYNWVSPPTPSTPVTLVQSGRSYSDTSWNAHGGVTWKFMPDWSMSFITASAFRAPDLMERFKYINLGGGVALFGNPDLDPERSVFLEYGLKHTTDRYTVSTSAYVNFLDDLITETVVDDTTHEMMNVDQARIYGGEIELACYVNPWLTATATLAYTHGENTRTDEPLAFISPLNGLVGLRYDGTARLWATIEMEWTADQNRTPDATPSGRGWERLNLHMGKKFTALGKDQELILGIDNLFDRDTTNYLSTSRNMELKEPGINFFCTWKIII